MGNYQRRYPPRPGITAGLNRDCRHRRHGRLPSVRCRHQKTFELGQRRRLAEPAALAQRATQFAQQVALLHGLDAGGDQRQAEVPSRRAQRRLARWSFGNRATKQATVVEPMPPGQGPGMPVFRRQIATRCQAASAADASRRIRP